MAVAVVKRGEVVPVPPEEAPPVAAEVLEGERHELDAARIAPRRRGEHGGLVLARDTPRGEHVDHRGAAAEVGDGHDTLRDGGAEAWRRTARVRPDRLEPEIRGGGLL